MISPSASAQVIYQGPGTYSTYGNQTYGPGGAQSRYGNQLYTPQGTFSTYGNQTYGPNGTRHTEIQPMDLTGRHRPHTEIKLTYTRQTAVQ